MGWEQSWVSGRKKHVSVTVRPAPASPQGLVATHTPLLGYLEPLLQLARLFSDPSSILDLQNQWMLSCALDFLHGLWLRSPS